MPGYSLSRAAVADLDAIWDYLDQEAGEQVADRQLDGLY